ncbi:cell division cycle protein 20 homolog [Haliotis rubra]|uniref:cell division cycle protein 20 homolog n=1 Tax=Haliotis rubra TaxID=36100 RepID=UPI001EE586B2|nr:cell division cycle protein 20 homolog [Haliotis rubra]
MSHFNLENEVSSLVRMDAPIAGGTRGPLTSRWTKKTDADCNISVNNSLNVSTSAKTPMKTANKSMGAGAKTPSTETKKTPKSSGKHRTPGGKAPKTPTGGDRFIPNRATTQFELGHYKIVSEGKPEDNELLSPTQQEYQRVMSDNLNGELLNSKIIAYKSKAPQAPEGYNNNLRVLYSTTKTTASAKKTIRHIPQVPERILDAPDILDDYYLNLLDWSVNNYLAVCLGSSVYLWNASSGDISQLCQMDGQDEYIGAVSWIKEGNYLAVGTSSGEVQLWDVMQQKKLRSMRSHAARVGSLSWNSYILSSGSRSGSIHHHDVRMAQHHVGSLTGHAQEVCGLKWSPDGKYLASGGNDNILNIWSAAMGSQSTENTQPLYSFSQHQAAVKAVAWCPWQSSLLASGGGTADRHIRFWNCNTGACLNAVDTKSQVCALLWSTEHRELISSHGFAQNQLIIWKYPAMSKIAELTGHTARVLHMAMSPDGTTVVSAGADETLRLWKCFAVDEKKKTTQKSASKGTSSTLHRALIR